MKIEITDEEMDMINDSLWNARGDIWQSIRVNESNLTGIDPCFPNDEPCKP